jgi:hypothetical protein
MDLSSSTRGFAPSKFWEPLNRNSENKFIIPEAKKINTLINKKHDKVDQK